MLQLPEFTATQIFPSSSDTGEAAGVAITNMMDPFMTLAMATAFGCVVACLHLISHRESTNARLWRTLILLSPLIAMATMAVGTNLAAAFTLFGTLAIVRFRTPIKEPLDAAFVIFSVVIGLAAGNQNFYVAGMGTLVIAVTVLILIAICSVGTKKPLGRLRLTLNTHDAPSDQWKSLLQERGASWRLKSCEIDQATATQVLTLEITGLAPDQWPDMLSALIANEHITRASGGPKDD